MSNKKTFHFDVHQVMGIYFNPETKNNDMVWVDSEPIYKFFGLIKTKKFTESGWMDCSTISFSIYSEDEVKSMGFIVKDKTVYHKPKITIIFKNKQRVEKEYNDEQTAIEYIENLKLATGKTFHTIN